MKRIRSSEYIFAVLSVTVLLLCYPTEAKEGAIYGISLCGTVIIPALLPFMTVTVILTNLMPNRLPHFAEWFADRLFGFNGIELTVYILSMIGGYPVGARLLSEIYRSGQISKSHARKMLPFCVNAGPGFILSAVGIGIFASKTIGLLLLLSTILSSILITTLLCRIKPSPVHTDISSKPVRFSTVLTESVSGSAQAVISICAYVIIFASIGAIFQNRFSGLPLAGTLLALLEVTTGLAGTQSIYKAVFLIAFSGFSVWMQVFSLSRDIGACVPEFALVRILHGLLSAAILRFLTFLYPVAVPTLSNHQPFTSGFRSSVPLIITLFIMILLLLITVYGKNNGGNLEKDVL